MSSIQMARKLKRSIAEPAFTPDGKHIYFSQDVTSGWVWQYNKDSTGELFGMKRLDLATGDTVTVTGGAGWRRAAGSLSKW